MPGDTKINWKNMNEALSPHFRVHEALWLPSWRIYHIPSSVEKREILKTVEVMERIRLFVKAPISVHCWIRPLSVNAPGSPRHGGNYNRAIGSRSTRSAHIFGRAVDFHVNGYTGPEGCAAMREKFLPRLEEWGIRMENISGAWIHIDTNPVVHNRFFKP